jgi:CBS domain-containing protein
MTTIGDLLRDKGSHVWSIGRDATVLQAALVMNEHKIGALLVLDAGQVVGVFTERDVLRRVVGEQLDPVKTRVVEVMTADVVCCTAETSVEEARGSMKNRRIRHLPVVDGDGRLHGLISIGDLNAHLEATQEKTIHFLNEYLYGRV